MTKINEKDRQMKYTPRKVISEMGEGVLEVKCHSIDCIHNDRTRRDNGFGFCSRDELEWGERCHNYKMDVFYMAWTLHEDVVSRKHMKRKEPRKFKNGGAVWVES